MPTPSRPRDPRRTGKFPGDPESFRPFRPPMPSRFPARHLREVLSMARIVIVGGGVAGLSAAGVLARARRRPEILVLDSHGDHLYQPGLVRVPLEGEDPDLARPGDHLVRRGVAYRVGRVQAIDRDRREVRLEDGARVPYDWAILASGARLHHETVPGAREGAHNFHCRKAAARLGAELRRFDGGRILLGTLPGPFKNPAAVAEFACLLDEALRRRGLRPRTELTVFGPEPWPAPDGTLGRALLELLGERKIAYRGSLHLRSVDPAARRAHFDGEFLPYELLVVVPEHRPQPFVAASGLAGPREWIPVDPETLRAGDRLYAVGDTAELDAPKLGSAARLQARVAAGNVLDEIEGRAPSRRYDGRALLAVEAGGGKALDVRFLRNAPPRVRGPSRWTGWRKRLLKRVYFRWIGR